MANYSSSKQLFANNMQTIASAILKLAEQLGELNACYSVHGFQSGGANAFVDTDFSSSNTHLTAQIVVDVMYAINVLDGQLTAGVRNSLRECLAGGLP